MYDFKYKINNNQRFNSYEIYIQKEKNKSNTYKTLRNTLFFTLLIVVIFIIGLFVKNHYQGSENRINLKPIVIKEVLNSTLHLQDTTHITLTNAITNSVVNNLIEHKTVKNINYQELKLIIKKVVNRVQKRPESIKIKKG